MNHPYRFVMVFECNTPIDSSGFEELIHGALYRYTECRPEVSLSVKEMRLEEV